MIAAKYISRFLAGLLLLEVAACGGGGSSSAPAANVGNIPNLAAKPTPQSGALEAKKIKLAGKVFNTVNNEPIEQATIWIHVAVAPAPVASASAVPATPVPPTAPGATPVVSPSPVPGATSPPPLPSPALPNTAPTPSGAVASPSGSLKPLGNLTGQAPVRWQHVSRVGRATEEKTNIKSYRTTTNNQGKFWLNDIPEGDYNLTIMAPGYTTLTIVKAESSKLNIPLSPISPEQFSSAVTGMVLSTSDTPVEAVTVNSSFVQGDVVGISDTTNEIGEFTLPAVPFGKHTLVGFVMDNEQVIRQMGLEYGVQVTDKSIKAKESALKTKANPIKPFTKGTASPKSSSKPLSKMDKLQQDVKDMLKASASPKPEESDPDNASPQPDNSPTTSSSASATPKASASASSSPKGKSSPAASTAPSNKPNLPSAAASPSASLTPVRPITPPSAAPSVVPSPQEENEEQPATPTDKKADLDDKEDDGFNLFKAIGGVFTGKEPDGVKEGSVYPVITLRTVISDFILEGAVTVPAGYTLTGVDVYLAFKAEQKKWPDEVFLFNQNLRAKTPKGEPSPGASPSPSASPSEAPSSKPSFRLRLPDLENGQSYHLQFNFMGSDKRTMVYKHLYDLKESKSNLEVDPLMAVKKIAIEGEEKNTIPLTPVFSWEPVTGAEIYQIQLEAGSDEHTQVVWEAWTRDTSIEYPLSTIPGRLKEKELYRVSVSALKGLRGLQKAGSEPFAYPTYRAIWTDLAQTYHKSFEVVKAIN